MSKYERGHCFIGKQKRIDILRENEEIASRHLEACEDGCQSESMYAPSEEWLKGSDTLSLADMAATDFAWNNFRSATMEWAHCAARLLSYYNAADSREQREKEREAASAISEEFHKVIKPRLQYLGRGMWEEIATYGYLI